MYIEKITFNRDYNIVIALSKAVSLHNSIISTVTNHKLIDLFNDNNNKYNEEVINNTKQFQSNINNNKVIYSIDSKILISSNYQKKGKTLNIKYNHKGNKIIPGIVIGLANWYIYPIRISLDYKDLKKNFVYDIDYRLIKQINDIVYNNVLNNGLQSLDEFEKNYSEDDIKYEYNSNMDIDE